MAERDVLADAKERFKECEEADHENRQNYVDDVRFAKLSEQWPDSIAQQRAQEQRPCLTINRLPQFLRQVINGARQNRPAIAVKPVDSNADPLIADIYSGLVRNIEVSSNADVAYDTALDCAVTGGFGFFRVDLDYMRDDSFDLDIAINRIVNPLTVYGDPRSKEGDSSDWNYCFVTELIPEDEFERKYPDADKSNFNSDERDAHWRTENEIRVAEYWTREAVRKPIVRLSDGTTLLAEVYEKNRDLFDPAGLTVTGTRDIMGHEVTQRLITGSQVLKETRWVGKYIPLIPVYGEEINIEGRRYFVSLIRNAKDPQRMFNYWRSAATELVALAPRVPYIGPRGFAKSDPRWETVTTQSHPYLEYDGNIPPQRQPLDSGAAAGALQEALNASDDLKAVMGIYDASLGARSNETSGRAIIARQREGDVSTFHFLDNLGRAVRHCGRVLVDLIPHVYTKDRIVRVLGEDGKSRQIQLGQPMIGPDGLPLQAPDGKVKVYDLAVGKYDVVVRTGPSFSTRREESAQQMIEFVRNYPPAAPVMGDVIARNMDWPEADKIEQRLLSLMPPHVTGRGPTPGEMQMQQQMQQMQQQMAQLMQQFQQTQRELEQAQAQLEQSRAQMKMNADANALKLQELQLSAQEASADVALKNRELDIKEKELELKAAEFAARAVDSRQEMQQAHAALQEQINALAEQVREALKPRKKTGKAVRLDNGVWQLEAVEVPQTLQ